VTARNDEGLSARSPARDAGQRAEDPESDGLETVEERDAAEIVEHDLDDLVRQRNDLRELAQRVQADFENYRKRVLREQTAVVERATEGLVEALLPVLDSFSLALGTLDGTDEKVRKGVELVYAELLGVLEKHGLEQIETDGTAFDPNVHEAVRFEDGDGEAIVAETMRPGYRLKGRVLRPAMVKVSR
jgi:molecular chaperone GrpE